MILFSSKKSAVHDMHLDALGGYARQQGLPTSAHLYAFSGMSEMLKSDDPVVFSQATGVPSLLALPLARLKGKRVVHYMHEPTPLRRKLKENPWIKSVLWHAVQWVEMRAASRVLVSRPALMDQAVAVYGVSRDKIALAPLLMPEVAPTDRDKTRITYLGRIDERRFFREFLEMAPTLAARGYVPTVLTGDIATFEGYRDDLPSELEVLAERNFSEELKTRILSETLCLWNPKRGEIAQSGVTADAVRYGIAIMLTDKDPSFEVLREAGIAVEFHTAQEGGFAILDEIDPVVVSTAAAALFSDQHGAAAFMRCYQPELS